MYSGAEIDVERRSTAQDRQCRVDSSDRVLEHDHMTVAGLFDDFAAASVRLDIHEGIEPVEQLVPPTVAKGGGGRRRSHDVGEQNRGDIPRRCTHRRRTYE